MQSARSFICPQCEFETHPRVEDKDGVVTLICRECGFRFTEDEAESLDYDDDSLEDDGDDWDAEHRENADFAQDEFPNGFEYEGDFGDFRDLGDE